MQKYLSCLSLQEFAQQWAEENDDLFSGEESPCSQHDRRLLWSTQGRRTDPDQGAVMDAVWDKYFDSR